MEDERVFLLPGEMCVSREPVEIATLLGSCVAVCLFNRKLKCGGMNHFMLAKTPAGDVPSGKHGDYSTEMLIKMMLSLDSNIGNIDVSILGGGNVTDHLSVGMGIGAHNIVAAREIVDKYSLRVVNRDVGGLYGRKIYFKNYTGEIEVRRIEKSSQVKEIEEKRKDISGRRIKVLIVDDSKTVRDLICAGITSDPEIEVVGQAANPYEARELLLETDPDVICLDIIMPRMDGITFLKKLFLYKPKPVIIISTVAQEGSKLREQAQKIGAVDVIDKEKLSIYQGLDVVKLALIPKIKSAAVAYVTKKTEKELEGI